MNVKCILPSLLDQTPDIREMWHTISKSAASKPLSAFATPSTLTTTERDDISSISSDFLNNEDVQMNVALRNSMKDSWTKSTCTPDGQHINELRAKRRLFQQADKDNLDRKRAAVTGTMTRPLTIKDSPPSVAYGSATKVSNRIHNNGLDPAYYMLTQHENAVSPQITAPLPVPKSESTIHSKLEQSIRIECIRLMRNGSNQDSSVKNRARTLYRLINRKVPSDKYADIVSITEDCDHCGMTIESTVELMLSMVE